jgi:hypothetical protein
LETCAKDISSIMDTGIKSFEQQPMAQQLLKEIQDLTKSSQSTSTETTRPKQWASELEGLLRHQLEKQQSALKESSVVFAHKRLPIDHSEVVAQAKEAIDSSVKMRKRIEQLSTGSFDGPVAVGSMQHHQQQRPDEKTAEVMHQSGSIGASSEDLEKCTQAVARTRNLLRRVRQALDGIVRAQTLDTEDTKKSLIIGLQRTKMPTVVRNEHVPKNLQTIDANLQSEIRLLLETLTVDRSALDLALRNIKTKCAYIQDNNKAEASMTRAILMKRLKMQLQDAFDSFVKSIQMY